MYKTEFRNPKHDLSSPSQDGSCTLLLPRFCSPPPTPLRGMTLTLTGHVLSTCPLGLLCLQAEQHAPLDCFHSTNCSVLGPPADFAVAPLACDPFEDEESSFWCHSTGSKPGTWTDFRSHCMWMWSFTLRNEIIWFLRNEYYQPACFTFALFLMRELGYP